MLARDAFQILCFNEFRLQFRTSLTKTIQFIRQFLSIYCI